MAKHLTSRDIQAILDLIHGYQEEKLTWEGVCETAEAVVGKKPTRQSLYSHQSIREAFKAKKQQLKSVGVKRPLPSNLKAAADRIAKLQSEADLLKKKNSGSFLNCVGSA